jgi:hypothetical protein
MRLDAFFVRRIWRSNMWRECGADTREKTKMNDGAGAGRWFTWKVGQKYGGAWGPLYKMCTRIGRAVKMIRAFVGEIVVGEGAVTYGG